MTMIGSNEWRGSIQCVPHCGYFINTGTKVHPDQLWVFTIIVHTSVQLHENHASYAQGQYSHPDA